jgi:predicted NUDIX family phosphoesterase
LHGLYSVGIGGHISEEDNLLFSSDIGYQEGMLREVREEVDVDQMEAPAVGVINDDSTEVGYVHFGVVHIMRVNNEKVAGRRNGIVSPEFIPIADAVANASSYESWSRFCLENLETLLAKTTASPTGCPQRV